MFWDSHGYLQSKFILNTVESECTKMFSLSLNIILGRGIHVFTLASLIDCSYKKLQIAWVLTVCHAMWRWSRLSTLMLKTSFSNQIGQDIWTFRYLYFLLCSKYGKLRLRKSCNLWAMINIETFDIGLNYIFLYIHAS